LILPLAIVGFTWSSVATISFAAGTTGGPGEQLSTRRPIAAQMQAPPTLVAPVRPTPTPLPPPPTPTPRAATYVVQPGDELKHIAAEYRMNIFTLIDANRIEDPDNLKVGQVLKIPD
jgi:LysM repeat protein